MNFIITPTYNERNNIRVLVDKIFTLYPAIHILVVDDNSPDGTAKVVKDLQLKYPNLHLKERASKLGLASAYLESFKDVLREYPNVRTIITMDADLSHDPRVISTMLREMELGIEKLNLEANKKALMTRTEFLQTWILNRSKIVAKDFEARIELIDAEATWSEISNQERLLKED